MFCDTTATLRFLGTGIGARSGEHLCRQGTSIRREKYEPSKNEFMCELARKIRERIGGLGELMRNFEGVNEELGPGSKFRFRNRKPCLQEPGLGFLSCLGSLEALDPLSLGFFLREVPSGQPQRAAPHGVEGRRGRRTSIKTPQKISSNFATSRSKASG